MIPPCLLLTPPRREALPLRYRVVLCTPPVTAQGSRYHFVDFVLSPELLWLSEERQILLGLSLMSSDSLLVLDLRSTLVKA